MFNQLLHNLTGNARDVWARVQNYWETEWAAMLFELAVIWVVVYLILRFLRGTRGARVIKGVAIILIIGTLTIQIFGGANQLERLSFLYSGFLGFISVALRMAVTLGAGASEVFSAGGLELMLQCFSALFAQVLDCSTQFIPCAATSWFCFFVLVAVHR